ncbi:ABC-F family ATP-binding cassette domain-containing protein [Nocardioides sp.]|jgi:ATPase subunit of ABC transporter with duplicated ATPase domains|uniref:ABC-F family ATP-binding cassette domain-containing protein n=1 Tax=Nocardioides sp. TaxID=35761 RepID=UPI002C6A8F13|nr:ABC-F family ATP-binding cassette domain-containing protein [Nocardioides sp.]HVX52963.1 ABC-F family ATP-binding cassette domain-containing protein [Nocardioides sp.]
MSATLQVRDLAVGYGARALFDALDLVVAPGDVVGLVGPNGAGKSTLLRTLAGELAPEEGQVSLTPPTAVVGYLPQETERRPGETVRDFLARRTGVAAAQQRYDAATAGYDDDPDGYAEALERWLALGGADLEERAEQVVADLGLTVGLDALMTSLSGGQAARANLASLLLSRYDVFLLDEPTNDLDLDGLDRLERFVTGLRAGVIVVSHDREFLARTVNRVLELDLHQHQVNLYGGGYDAYLREREVARRHAREAYEEYAGKLGGLRDRMITQRSWATQGVRNARRKQATERDKFVRNFAADSAEKQAAKVRQSEKAIERLERNAVEEPRKEWELRMEIAAAPRSGAVTAALRGATLRRGDFVLGPVDLEIGWAEKVAITGPNGAGKSTLLAAFLGRLPLDVGESYLGPGVVVGEVDQARRLFERETALVDAFATHVPDLAPEEIRTLLAKYSLKADHVVRPASSLSPGERTRAALALLQARGVNLLVLDEPTNHLDLPAIEQLEQALATYPGTLLLVTHDRRMLAAVHTTRRLDVADGRVCES